jgi:membrane-bound lytic murein transglycosylase MltF
MRSLSRSAALIILTLILGACSSQSPAPRTAAGATPAPVSPEDDTIPPTPSPYDVLPPDVRARLDEPFTGDFDEMVKRRLIRAGVVYNRMQYFVDKGVQRGISYESLRLFENEINNGLKTGVPSVYVAIVPLRRDQLSAALTDGKVDLVAATITITPDRRKVAAFSNPTRKDVSEIVVTNAKAPYVDTLDALSGRTVFVRRRSVYYDTVVALNESLTRRGKPPVVIKEAPEPLEDDDVLEMVNAGLVEATVVDDFVARFWSQVFFNIRLNGGAALRSGGDIGVAVRKNNPQLLQAVNGWVARHGPSTAFANKMDVQYLLTTKYITGATDEDARLRLLASAKMFKTYGDRYNLDYLLMAAQAYQDSGLSQTATTEEKIDENAKYFRFMMDTYYKDDPMDPLNKGLMTMASYRVGPGRVRQLRAETARRGLDPNAWFGNVERVTSERIGRSAVEYVNDVYKYYVAYQLIMERAQQH